VQSAPTTCPNDPSHTIDGDSIVLIATEPVADRIQKAVAAVSETLETSIETSIGAAKIAFDEDIQSIETLVDTTKTVLQASVTAAVETVSADLRSVLRYVPVLADNSVVSKSLTRVASFLWHNDARLPPSRMYVRGMTRKVDKGEVWLIVFDLDKNARIATQSFELQLPMPQTLTVDLEPVAHADTEPYPIEVFAWAEDRFTVESIAIID
jgi:hypothetical protein